MLVMKRYDHFDLVTAFSLILMNKKKELEFKIRTTNTRCRSIKLVLCLNLHQSTGCCEAREKHSTFCLNSALILENN